MLTAHSRRLASIAGVVLAASTVVAVSSPAMLAACNHVVGHALPGGGGQAGRLDLAQRAPDITACWIVVVLLCTADGASAFRVSL